jgi:outer membrane protein
VQTLGLGNSDTDELPGIADRKWILEIGPMIGWCRWPVQIVLKSYTEVSDRHDGFISELIFSAPFEFSRAFIVPAFDVIHQSKDYVDYYYAVSQAEATPSRPTYRADNAIITAVQIRRGHALSDKWLLSGHLV